MTIDAGKLDREIVLHTAEQVQDTTTGEAGPDWAHATTATIWAQWLPAGTREAWHAQQRLSSYVDGVFRIYDRSPRPLPEASRIVFDGKTFDVKPYVEIGRGEGLDIPVVARGEGA